MQWTFTCVLLASCAVISASDHGVRSKRDLSFIKRYFMSKILGHHAANTTKIVNPSENYRLFRIPGHDKILVKAVPKIPVVFDTEAAYPAVSEVIETESVPVHPSIAIVSKYLGTSQLNDTLFALKGVKNLLQSGVLTAQREGIDQISTFKEELLQPVLVESSNIAVGYNKRPVMVYPTLGETLIGKITPGHRYPNIKVPTHYSYKQVNKGGVTSYTAHDSQNVLVTEIKRPVPLPAPVNHRIWEILSLGSYRLPTSPVVRPVIGMEKDELPPVNMVPGYHSNHLYHEGSGTMHSAQMVLQVEDDTPVVIEKVTKPVVSKVEGVYKVHGSTHKVKLPSHSSGYSYNQVHNDGSVTMYSGSGKIVEHEGEKSTIVMTEPGRPTLVVPSVERPPAPIPVYNVPKVKIPSGSGYSYNHVHNDGFVTTYLGSGHVKHVGEKPAMVITEPGRPTVVMADVEGPPAPIPVYNLPKVKVPSNSGYAYSHVHNDGLITTYAGSGHMVEHLGVQPPVVITEPGRPTVVVADVQGPPAPIPAYNLPKVEAPSSSGYSYSHVHNDGSMTTYAGSGHVVEHEGEMPPVVITEPGRPTVVVADVERPPVMVPVYNSPKVKAPSGSGYSYSHVHNDGSMTTYNGSGHVVEHEGEIPPVVITEPGRPTVVVDDVERPPVMVPVYNSPRVKAPSGSGFSYDHVHNDGSVTTYSGTGQVVEHEEKKSGVVISAYGKPTVVMAGAEGLPAPMPDYNLPNAPSGSGYTYNHVHNDGFMTTYSGSGRVDHVGEKPAMVITEPGRPTVVVADVEGPPAPIPAYNLPKVKAPSGSGFFYNHVHNDGSVTTYSGSGNVVEHEGERPPVVITEPGRPTVVVADVEGPPAPMPVYNLPKAPSGSGYFYDHVRNDGLITTYTGSGKVNEHRGERPAAVFTEPGRPTVVVSGVDGHAAPIPVYNAPKAQTGYSYSHMNNDAFMKNNYNQINTLIVEERPEHMYKYEHVRNSYEMPQRPHIREQVKVNVNSQNENSRPSPSSHTGFSYKTVHEDGSVTDYSDVKVTDGAKLDRPMLYPTGPAETHQHDKGHSAVAEKCKNRTRGGVSKNCKSHSVAVSSNSSHYSYKTVSQDGSTSYSGSGHVQVESAKFDTAAHDKEVSSSIVNAPLLVTQTDDDSPQKVTFTPILSKFSYKQVNNHKPDDFQDEKVNNVISAINRTSESQSIDVSEAPKDVYVTPPEVNEPVPIKKPVQETINTTKKTVAVPYTTRKSVAVSTSTKSSHFKPKRVYRKRVRTSTSRSSLRTSVPETTTPQESSSTAVTTEGSLSANPIVVLPEEEKVFPFKQERSDGSSITVVGDKDNKVSAVLEESKTSLDRGDIPESSF
ncbi:uncharacterized protein LOC114353340 isoform X2 [Ostrinia furnacalis]|uniref:uncharacterized protein LOC114353340 isoform X2 n=1 Tax=Ostrinia furnacalis TaxID=93504 RepID=UPI0010390CF2|nr:uncharacterized protein LOC114353340 isoform X2 [Ostrinia furnacalis]